MQTQCRCVSAFILFVRSVLVPFTLVPFVRIPFVRCRSPFPSSFPTPFSSQSCIASGGAVLSRPLCVVFYLSCFTSPSRSFPAVHHLAIPLLLRRADSPSLHSSLSRSWTTTASAYPQLASCWCRCAPRAPSFVFSPSFILFSLFSFVSRFRFPPSVFAFASTLACALFVSRPSLHVHPYRTLHIRVVFIPSLSLLFAVPQCPTLQTWCLVREVGYVHGFVPSLLVSSLSRVRVPTHSHHPLPHYPTLHIARSPFHIHIHVDVDVLRSHPRVPRPVSLLSLVSVCSSLRRLCRCVVFVSFNSFDSFRLRRSFDSFRSSSAGFSFWFWFWFWLCVRHISSPPRPHSLLHPSHPCSSLLIPPFQLPAARSSRVSRIRVLRSSHAHPTPANCEPGQRTLHPPTRARRRQNKNKIKKSKQNKTSEMSVRCVPHCSLLILFLSFPFFFVRCFVIIRSFVGSFVRSCCIPGSRSVPILVSSRVCSRSRSRFRLVFVSFVRASLVHLVRSLCSALPATRSDPDPFALCTIWHPGRERASPPRFWTLSHDLRYSTRSGGFRRGYRR